MNQPLNICDNSECHEVNRRINSKLRDERDAERLRANMLTEDLYRLELKHKSLRTTISGCIYRLDPSPCKTCREVRASLLEAIAVDDLE